MARRHWTLMIVPDDHAGVKQYRLSERSLRAYGGGALVVLLNLGSLAAGFVVRESHRLTADRLARALAALATMLEPFMPERMPRLAADLGMDRIPLLDDVAELDLAGHRVRRGDVLFPRPER